MPERPKIALDFDDTLMPTREAIVPLLNAHRGTAVDLRTCREFYLQRIWNMQRHEFTAFFKAHEEKIHDIPPFDGALHTLAAWSQLADLHVITGRPESWKDSAVRWLERHGIPVKGVWCTETVGTKSKWILETGMRFIVEDRVDFSREIAEAGVPVILLDRLYNQELTHPLIHRAADWYAAKKYVADQRLLENTVVNKALS